MSKKHNLQPPKTGQAHTVPGVPTEQLKSQVLDIAYRADGIRRIQGFQLLAASHRTTGVGIFVVASNFSREHFHLAIAEAKSAGLRTPRMIVFGDTATYTGPAIDFNKFEHIGIATGTPKTEPVGTINAPSVSALNTLEAYAHAGTMAGTAARRRDTACSEFHSNWARNAIALESPEYGRKARQVFDNAYRAEAEPSVMLG